MSRTRYLFGSWKNRLDLAASLELFSELSKNIAPTPGLVVGVCPSHVALPMLAELARDIELAAQNCGWDAAHALTGEISARDLKLLGVRYCLVGHSERRLHLAEDETIIAKRLSALMQGDLTPILCIGENSADASHDERMAALAPQIETVAALLDQNKAASCIIAYEPMWAISTAGGGAAMAPGKAGEIAGAIRSALAARIGAARAEALPLLYGGAVDAESAPLYVAHPDLDGCLVGAASQQAASFLALHASFGGVNAARTAP